MRRAAGGFTVLELLVSLALLGLGIVAVLEGISKGLVGARDMDDYQTAVMLARLQMNQILLLPELPYGGEEGEFGDLYPDFRWRSEVDSVESDTEADLALVQVTVTWARGASERRYPLQTLWSESLRDTLLGNAQVDFAGEEAAPGAGGQLPGAGGQLPGAGGGLR